MDNAEMGLATDVAVRDAAVPGRTVVENCEDEPIRIPGSIQRHGFLLLLDESNEMVVAASVNAEEFLQAPLRLILGTALETVLEREVLAVVRALAHTSEVAGQITYLGSFPLRQELYSVVTHLLDGLRVLEFERVDRLVSPELMNAVITNFVGKLSKLGNEMALCRAITTQVKELTGFNRILLYRFDEFGHGTVLTEENDGILPSYLDLRFPASDIPNQARELYISNTVRIIPNAVYTPSPLKGASGRQMKAFDLSSSVLRSVSPIHLEYMQNMGTMASMSISIVFEGRLWGLISCHHAEPRSVPYVVRSACDLLTKMVSTQLLAFRSASELERATHFHAVQRNLLTQMAAEQSYVAALVSRIGELQQITNANGTALVMDGRCILGGKTPLKADVLKLAEWMYARPGSNLVHTSHLQEVCEWTDRIKTIASGLLAVRLSDVKKSYLMWFRPEVIGTVTWAGEPIKVGDHGHGLHPRSSFAAWRQLVHGHSIPWTDMEVESAEEFRTALMTISLKRAEEAVEFSEARFQQLTHALPNLVWAAEDDGELTYVNERWQQSGLRDSGVWYEQEQLSVEDQEICRNAWAKAISTETAFELELRLHQKNSEVGQWNLVRAMPFQGAGGVRVGWVGTFTDLTERREREMALKMTEKLALTGRMTSFIAHEINNPLEALTNIHYLLGEEVRGNNPALAYIAMADHELERISGITKQTLRWSKENSQTPEEGLAGTLFDDVLRLFAGKIRNREVTVTVSGEETRLFGVIGQILQVVVNLVSNALDAVPVGGHVWLSAAAGEANTEIVVGDAGTGISDETQRLIFQPFFSTKGDFGNGLGLYISREIAERHGGTLIVDSTVGDGTQMRLTLPIHEASLIL